MRTGPTFFTIAVQEVRRAYLNTWARLAMLFILAYTVVYLGNLYTLSQRPGTTVHTLDNFVDFMDTLRWGGLAVAAVMAGPALLEDQRRGALELYFTRAVTRADYLAGKVLAVLGVSTLALLAPGVIYYASTFFLIDEQPADWNLIPGGLILYALMWGLLVSGLGLGLSSVARSSRGATLLLLGGFAVLEIFISDLLRDITRSDVLQIVSPFSALSKQNEWIFQVETDLVFPAWWGLVLWGALVLIGWGLLAWKHPRPRGVEPAGR